MMPMFREKLLVEVRAKNIIPEVPEKIHLRALRGNDFDRGYLDLLKQLTTVGEINKQDFLQRFNDMTLCSPQQYFVLVLERFDTGRVVAAGTLVLEMKIIHELGMRGRIEDIVVDENYRKEGYAILIMHYLIGIAEIHNVYKLSLECKESLITFYQQFGFKKDPKNFFMIQDLDPEEPIRHP